MPRGPGSKEIDQLKRRRQRAQDSGDISEEAKICNAIGDLYLQSREYCHALHYHRIELSLSEAGGDQLGAAIAHRKIGECECELGNYSSALDHQTQHLKIARQLGDAVEEQRALATLGRTYLMQSEGDGEGEEKEVLLKAGNAFLKSLDVCDKIVNIVRERELLEMKSRLYLNLGIVYEGQSDLSSARKFMEKALRIVKELGDSATVFRCHYSLGSLHVKERHPAMAVSCFKEALVVASEPPDKADVLREMAQVHLLMSGFSEAKSCLKQALRLLEGSQGEMEYTQQKLRAVRKILHISVEVEDVSVERMGEKMHLYDKLGDLCCSVKAYQAAIKFYSQQLTLAEAHGLEPRELSVIYCSLARTHTDCGQFSQALLHYQRELELWRGNPSEECDTWNSIAKVHAKAGHDRELVLEAFCKAAELAQTPQQKIGVHKATLQYLRSLPWDAREKEVTHWEERLSRLLLEHPEADATLSSDSGSEDAIGDSEPPPSLPSTGSEEEECTRVIRPRPSTGVAIRKKSRINQRNEKGETLLHIAAIDGNLTAVRQLIREGAEVNARDNCGWIPLHEACNHGHLDIVRCLLDAGAAVNDQGGPKCNGVTPLIDAATNGHVAIVRMLVEIGADIGRRDSYGRTALGVVEEKLSSVAELGQRYDLAEEHQAIRDFLRGRMSEQGGGGGGGGSRTHARVGRGGGRRGRGFDRTGSGVLYSSDEEEVAIPCQLRSQGDNPFQSFTVPTSGPPVPRLTSRGGGSSHVVRGVFNPLGQVEVPALIPEGEDREEEEEEQGYRVLDDWLVDDLGQPPPKRKRQRELEEGATGSLQRSGSHQSLRQSGSGGRKRRKRASGWWQPETSVVEINSDSEYNPDPERRTSTDTFGSGVTITSAPLQPPVSVLADAPLRIKVRIEGTSYLIPCPRRTEEGENTTIAWLAAEAAERYYSQHRVRPQLSLATVDGALLCPSDTAAHVLQNNEEVVGRVEHWHHPPLSERYQTACRTAGVACHSIILKLFQGSGGSSSWDLSTLGLCPHHISPLCQALHGQHTLSSLSFSGNRLKDGAMRHVALALAHLPALHSLDLSCTGITSQGVDSLTNPYSSSSSSSPGPWHCLQQLVLSYNSLGPLAGPALARMLQCCPALQELQVASCGLTKSVLDSHTGLQEALHGLTGLTEALFSHNPLGGDGVSLLLQALPRDRLARLTLSGTCNNPQQFSGVMEEPTMAKFFREVGRSLEHLDVSHCGVGGEEMGALVEGLGGCKQLQELRMAGGIFTLAGITQLCRYLPSASTLRSLDLSGNTELGNHGCLQVLRACRKLSLSSLSLAACGMVSPLPDTLVQMLSSFTCKIELTGNSIDNTDKLFIRSPVV